MRNSSWYSISSSPSFRKKRPPRFILARCTAGMIDASICSPMFSTSMGNPTKHSFSRQELLRAQPRDPRIFGDL